MSITLDGIVFDEAQFAGGGYLDLVTVNGVQYPRWQAFLVAALRDAAKLLVGSSTSSVAIGSGAKSFVLAVDIPFNAGGNVKIVDIASPTTNWMFGEVTSYTSATKTLVVNVTKTAGGGTLANWRVIGAGPQGEAGAPGSAPYGATLPSALGTAATGSNADAARIDHVHPAADLATAQVTGTLPVSKGGTGGATAAAARGGIGITAAGDGVVTAASAAAARAALGATTVGANVFTAADEAAARSAIGSIVPHPGIATNRYYTTLANNMAPSGVIVAANVLYAVPIIIPASTDFTRIGIDVVSPVAGNARLGIYNNDGVGGPSTLVLDAGTVSTATTGEKEITIAQTLAAGVYWLTAVCDAAPTVRGWSGSAQTLVLLGSSSASLFTTQNSLSRAFTYAALPAPFGGSPALTTIGPAVWLRKV